MIYKLVIPNLLSEEFESDVDFQPLSSNIVDWSIDPDTLEIILDSNLDVLKIDNTITVDYLSEITNGQYIFGYNDTTIETIGSDTFAVNDIVWIENEPMTITYKNSSTSYTVERAFRRTHIFSSGLITKDRPISVIGTFGYIQDENDNILKWVYVNSLSTNGAGAILECEDILKLYDNDYPIIISNSNNNIVPTYGVLQDVGLEFWISNLANIQALNFVDKWENSNYFNSCNPFEILMSSIKLSGKILRFNNSTGKFTIIAPQQPDIFNTSVVDITLDDNISYSGGYNFQSLVKGVKVSVKANTYNIVDNGLEKGSDISFSVNFGASFNGTVEEIELDFTSIVPYDSGNILVDELEIISWFKNRILNGVASVKQLSYGILTINSMPNHIFNVGTFYSLTDSHLFELFLKDSSSIYLLCIQTSLEEVKFLVLQRFAFAPISPAIICEYIGDDGSGNGYGLQLKNVNNEYDTANFYDYFNIERGSSLETLNVSGTLTYEVLEYIRAINISTATGVIKKINKIVGNIIYLETSTGMTLNTEYILTFPTTTGTSSAKQKKYLWVNGGVNV